VLEALKTVILQNSVLLSIFFSSLIRTPQTYTDFRKQVEFKTKIRACLDTLSVFPPPPGSLYEKFNEDVSFRDICGK